MLLYNITHKLPNLAIMDRPTAVFNNLTQETIMKSLPLLAITTLIAGPLTAEETRHADSHEHGVGELNIAFEGNAVALELHAPGSDIVGFEYAAKSDEDHVLIDAAVAKLSDFGNLIALPANAGCNIVDAHAALEGEDEHDDEVHDDHDDDKHEEEAEHTEFHVEYSLECTNPSALAEMTFTYFKTFPNALELEVQAITAKGASAFEMMRDAPTLDLRKLF
jgi:hypothetical protein